MKEGNFMQIKSSEKNWGRQKIHIVTDLYYRQGNVVRAVKLRAGKNYLERPIQHPYPLELTWDVTATSKTSNKKALDTKINANASELNWNPMLQP